MPFTHELHYMHLQTLDKERYFTTWNLNETDIFGGASTYIHDPA